MRKPACGLLVFVVVACAAPLAVASAAEPAKSPAAIAPCASSNARQTVEDSACCKVPLFQVASTAPVKVPAFAPAERPASKATQDEGSRK